MDWVNNPNDARVVAALTRKCGVCGAEEGVRCRSLTIVPLNRLVHLYRIEGV